MSIWEKFVGTVVKVVSPEKVKAPSATGVSPYGVSLLAPTEVVAETTRVRAHSESPEDARKQRALDYSSLSVASSSPMSEVASPERLSEPLAEPGLSKEEADDTLRAFKEQCEELTREHFATIKRMSDKFRVTLAIGGVSRGDGEKKELLKGALRQAEEVVGLLKALQGNSADALVPSPSVLLGLLFLMVPVPFSLVGYRERLKMVRF